MVRKLGGTDPHIEKFEVEKGGAQGGKKGVYGGSQDG